MAATASRRWRRAAALLLLATMIALLFAPSALARPLSLMVGVLLNLALAAIFTSTLRAGREPLISAFARAERGTLEPDLVRYTRTLTVVWVAFFVSAATVSIVLAVAAPNAQLAFAVVGNPLAVVALFVGEWLFRRWRFRQYRHASPLALAMIVVAHWRRRAGR